MNILESAFTCCVCAIVQFFRYSLLYADAMIIGRSVCLRFKFGIEDPNNMSYGIYYIYAIALFVSHHQNTDRGGLYV